MHQELRLELPLSWWLKRWEDSSWAVSDDLVSSCMFSTGQLHYKPQLSSNNSQPVKSSSFKVNIKFHRDSFVYNHLLSHSLSSSLTLWRMNMHMHAYPRRAFPDQLLCYLYQRTSQCFLEEPFWFLHIIMASYIVWLKAVSALLSSPNPNGLCLLACLLFSWPA